MKGGQRWLLVLADQIKNRFTDFFLRNNLFYIVV